MLGFIHSATCIRASNFKIDHSKLTLDVTQLSLGRIIPAISTTTACIVGYLMNEMVKMKIGILNIEDLKNYNINLGCSLITPHQVTSAKYKQENSDLNFKDIYKYAKNPDKFIDPNSANMKSNGFWNSWFKHTMNKTCTPRQIDQFLLEEYGAKVLYYEIYPDFLSKEGFEEKEGYDQPIINEFLTYLDLNNDDFCILHIGCETVIEGNLRSDVENTEENKKYIWNYDTTARERYVFVPPIKIMLK